MSGANVGPLASVEASTSCRAAVLGVGRRMERFEGEARSWLTREEMRQVREGVAAPLVQASRLLVPEGQRMTEVNWREAWRLVGQAARAWEALGAQLRSPSRALSAPAALAVERAEDMVNTAMSIAPNLGVAAAGGMVIAALVGLWVLKEIGSAVAGKR